MTTDNRGNLIEYFQRRKLECEESLRFGENTSWFRLHQTTQQGTVDITEEHKQGLRDQCAEYQRMLDYLQTDRS
jgi:hypothetical protein